jgi:hypothetical protein
MHAIGQTHDADLRGKYFCCATTKGQGPEAPSER